MLLVKAENRQAEKKGSAKEQRRPAPPAHGTAMPRRNAAVCGAA